jgi:hypothetical protein
MLANEQLESELEELRAVMATGGTLECRIDQSLHYRPVAALVHLGHASRHEAPD